MPAMTRWIRDPRRGGRGPQRFIVLLLAAVFLLSAHAASAQDAGSAEPAFDQAEIDALIQTIEDPEARAKLIEQLRLLNAARQQEQEQDETGPLVRDGLGAELLSSLSERIRELTVGLGSAGRAILAAPDAFLDLLQEAGDPRVRQRWIEIAAKLVIVLSGAFFARWLAERALRRPSRAIELRQDESLGVKVPMALLRGLLELLPIAAFAAVGNGILPLLDPREGTRTVALAAINAIVIVQMVRAVATVLLAPNAPALRLPRITGETANYIFIWISRLTSVAVYGYFLAEAALLLGLPFAVYELLLRVVGLLVAGMMIVLILQNRGAVTERLYGRPQDEGAGTEAQGRGRRAGLRALRRRLADVWHVLAIVYVVAGFVVWALGIPGGFEFLVRSTALSAIVLVLLRAAIAVMRRLTEHGFSLPSELKLRYPGLEMRANRYLQALDRLVAAVLYVVAVLWLLEIWGIDAFRWLESDFGRRLMSSAFSIVIIFVLAAVALDLIDALVQRYLQLNDVDGRPVVRSARVRTLLPLMRNALRVLLAVMVTLVVLSELGVNIAPLLAGAGVVGLAIGFGAQTLVKDVITGFFILAEDQISVGDIVDLGGKTGVVEAMTIRTIRLRDATGSVYLVPFSAVTTVKNMSKEFAYAKIDVRVVSTTDMEGIVAMMREVADGMRADTAYRNIILSDLEVWGLDGFDETSFTVVARLKTAPNHQWTVSREFRRRLKQFFDARGIPSSSPGEMFV